MAGQKMQFQGHAVGQAMARRSRAITNAAAWRQVGLSTVIFAFTLAFSSGSSPVLGAVFKVAVGLEAQPVKLVAFVGRA